MIYVTLRRQEVLPVNADYYLRAAVTAQNASVSTSVTRFQQYSPDLAVVVEIQVYTLEFCPFILLMQIVLSQELGSVKPWGMCIRICSCSISDDAGRVREIDCKHCSFHRLGRSSRPRGGGERRGGPRWRGRFLGGKSPGPYAESLALGGGGPFRGG